MRPRVKVCCIQDREEAWTAIRAGADAIGLVGRGLSGPEVIEDDDRIAHIAQSVPPGVDAFLLTKEAEPDALAAQVRRCATAVVQICDAVSPACYDAVRATSPSVKIVQVVHVGGPEALEEARAIAPLVDAVLLDSGVPTGPNPVFGGTGKTHDWDVSAAIVDALDTPVWLAGGLRVSNVADAFAKVQPYGLDLCSGVRTDGRLDPEKVRAFLGITNTLG